jgi:hypothetical protein
MVDLYLDMVDARPELFAAAVAAIADAPPGGVVFHCGGGRDRAGQIAALVLALVGVPVDAIVADYAEDAVLITPASVFRGRDGVREGFTGLLADLPEASWDVPTQVFEGDILFIEWSAVAASTRVTDGVDTFVFAGDLIRAQTVRCTLQTTT